MRITKFLVVEDNVHDVELVRAELEKAPIHFELRAVGNGMEAQEYLEGKEGYRDREIYPLPEVILLDLKMPQMGGFEFLGWLRTKADANQRLIPVVVLSNSDDPADVKKAYDLGANTYIFKPLRWREFQECIQTLGVQWAKYVEKPLNVTTNA